MGIGSAPAPAATDRSGLEVGEPRILAVSNAWPPMAAGTGRALQGLLGDRPGVTVLVPRGAERPRGDWPRVVDRLRFSGRFGGPLKVHSLLQHLEIVVRPLGHAIGREHRPDLILASQPLFGGAGAWLAGRVLGVPYIVMIHGEELTAALRDASPGRIRLRTLRRVLRDAAAIVCNTANTRRLAIELHAAPADRLAVIHPAVDPGEFDAHRDPAASAALRQRLAPDGPLLLAVGRLAEPHKGFDRAIESLPRVRSRHPGVRLVIAGPGDATALGELARRTGVADAVVFHGLASRDELVRLYDACDVFVLPGRTVDGSAEGFGVVFIEAALAAKPVIAGRTGGPAEAVEDGVTGLLVDGDSPAAVADAVVGLLDDPSRAAALGAAGRRRALRDFDGTRQRADFAALVERVLRERRPA